MKITCALVGVPLLVAASAQAVPVEVVVTGEVEFNQINVPPLDGVVPGDPATLTFTVDSDVFTDSMNFPTRGYDIDQASFSLMLGGVTVGLEDPFPAGQTPYFVLRDNDPAVDGFFTATNVDFPVGVPIDVTGIFGQFRNNYSVTYTGDTLSSLDILDALGTYDFTNLTVFNWSVDDGPFQPLFIIFEQMTISAAAVAEVPLDIKPGSCPNSFNRGSPGVLPAALLGSDVLDVSMIDVATLAIARVDGVGGTAAPIRSDLEDVGTPFGGELCDCHEMDGDGFMDLTLKFSTREVVEALELDGLPGGGMNMQLFVSGLFQDGTPFEGRDCIRIVPVGGPMGTTAAAFLLDRLQWSDAR